LSRRRRGWGHVVQYAQEKVARRAEGGCVSDEERGGDYDQRNL